MSPTSLAQFFTCSINISELLNLPTKAAIKELSGKPALYCLIDTISQLNVYDESLAVEFEDNDSVRSLYAYRQLKSALSLSCGKFLNELSSFINIVCKEDAVQWSLLADRVILDNELDKQMRLIVAEGPLANKFKLLEEKYLSKDAHVVYPTSPYRISQGHIVSNEDYTVIDGVISSTISTSIRVQNNALGIADPLLRSIYAPHRRCIALVDSNVDLHYKVDIQKYFEHHNIKLHYKVHRAMEVDKHINNVEKILAELKALGASRDEPILIIGGGVLADIAGFATALYHRNTPYVMLNTSVVSGIDAGPSPRTCSDGYGYKNLFGAYHAPILSITDKTFFKTLHKGWIRHGVAEIIKMGGVKDIKLLDLLEQVGPALVDTAFGTINTKQGTEVDVICNNILGLALKSYVESEYDNLYETHQCRPHAFGHTWSPGFEIASGMLHGHAVSVGMGFNGYLSYQKGWIEKDEFLRLLDIITLFGLSIWHDILLDTEILWSAQLKMTEKRGGNLAAPVPKGSLGMCGYINNISREELKNSILEYKKFCNLYPRKGVGIEPLCSDVGLEDPSVVGVAS
ncbi:MAG: sedoheptulose 7-phosphate cyclase [Puniceicoccaceae bacterium]|nr:sedoheptulose 7-phosphate cyclase [Puniceicoccaceae bacterium]